MSEENTPKGAGMFWVTMLAMVGGLGLAAFGSINSNMALFIVGVVILLAAPVAMRALRAQPVHDHSVEEEPSET